MIRQIRRGQRGRRRAYRLPIARWMVSLGWQARTPYSMDVLKTLFEQHFHSPVARVQPLQGQLGGSGRSIIRLAGDGLSAIGILHDIREENVAFLEFSRHFRRHGLPVPEVYAEDLSQGAYLEEDLGDTTLFEFLSRNRTGENIAPQVVEVYRKVVAVLPRFQIEAGRDLNYKVCYPRANFDRQSIAWDLNYFKYYFLRLAGIPFNEQGLEDDFGRLTKFLLSAGTITFSIGISNHATSCYATASRSSWIIKEAAKARCNMMSLLFCTTPKPICRRSCASNCWRIISTRLLVSSSLSAKSSCSTTMPTFTSASCRRWELTAFAAFMSAKLIFCKACRTR